MTTLNVTLAAVVAYPTDRPVKPWTPALWLAMSIGVLGVVVVAGFVYLWNREHLADKTHRTERQAICAILDHIPNATTYPPIMQAQRAFDCRGQ